MMRRTTVTADHDSLDTLEAEAKRRGVSLSAVLAEAVDDKAASIRAARRPRVALGRSRDGRSAAELTAEPVAEPPA
jgi:Ribbon-helix-helix protein, copG family